MLLVLLYAHRHSDRPCRVRLSAAYLLTPAAILLRRHVRPFMVDARGATHALG